MAAPRTRLFHPLMGADLWTLVRVLARNGGVSPARIPHAALALGAALARLPSTALERVRVERGLRSGAPAGAPPVFIVGHWRSGTTHLYNILAKAPSLAYVSPLATGMPWDFLGLGRALRPLLARALPGDRFIDRIPVEPDSPQEDEAALANMQPLSFYHGLYFPSRFEESFFRGVFFDGASPAEVEEWSARFLHFLAKIRIERPEAVPVVKNPVYTARVALLRRLVPGARFVHIHRNPFVVFQSMRGFYRVLFETLALQDARGVDADRVILEAYPRMLSACLRDAGDLPPERFLELRYDDLETAPIETVGRIFDAFGLDGFEEAEPRMRAYVTSIAGYRKNRHAYAEEDVATVRSHWGEFIDRWGYEPPV